MIEAIKLVTVFLLGLALGSWGIIWWLDDCRGARQARMAAMGCEACSKAAADASAACREARRP